MLLCELQTTAAEGNHIFIHTTFSISHLTVKCSLKMTDSTRSVTYSKSSKYLPAISIWDNTVKADWTYREEHCFSWAISIHCSQPNKPSTNPCCNTVLARLQSLERCVGVCVIIYTTMQYNTWTQTYYIKWKVAIKLHVLLGKTWREQGEFESTAG